MPTWVTSLPRAVLLLGILIFQRFTPGPRHYRRLTGGSGGT